MPAIKIHEHWCKQQQDDYDIMMKALDDLGAAAVGFATNGAQGYQQFIEARDNFRCQFKTMAQNYRYVEH